ncbi:hypothetical protein EB118_18990, partial [bacterium]|nr:hypothetical protein [bacterium]
TFANSINIQPSQDPLVIESVNDDLAFIRVKRTNGTLASKTAVLNGDFLGGIRFFGSSGNNFHPNASADVVFTAGQNFSSTARAGYIQFRTISTDNETNLVERLRIANNGYTRIASSGEFSAANTDQHEIYQGSPTATNAAVVITHAATAGNNKWISFRTGVGAASERGSITFNRANTVLQMSGSLILHNSATAPSSPARGQLFFDTVNNNFSGYNGTTWVKLNN